MREALTTDSLQSFMKALAFDAIEPTRIYFVGGASAVLLGWRSSTIDLDLKIIPESDEILRALPRPKERLRINIELASPDDFIPELPGWQERSRFIRDETKLSFYHYDFYAQALAKIERGHDIDVNDVKELIESGLVEVKRLSELFNSIKGQIYRYPALDAAAFQKAVDRVVKKFSDARR